MEVIFIINNIFKILESNDVREKEYKIELK
jgi:hypothetical protein